jgi:hypothetical protein
MHGPIPTQAGDVLILSKTGTTILVVGVVSADGGQAMSAMHELFSTIADAMRRAANLAKRSHRIYLKDTVSGEWSQVN